MTKHVSNKRRPHWFLRLPLTTASAALVVMLALGFASAHWQATATQAWQMVPQLVPQPGRAAAQSHVTGNDELTVAPQLNGFVIEADSGGAHCRNANEAEARALQQRAPALPLRVLTDDSGLQSHTLAGMKIILRSTAQLDQYPAAKAAFLRAAARWEAVIQNPITVVIDVDFGPTRFGETYPPNVIGSTGSQDLVNNGGYAGVRAALIAGASNAQEAALYNALPLGQVPTDIGPATLMLTPSAVFRALGIINPVADPDGERANFGPPPSIGFNSAFNFDFDPSDGIAPGKTDFDATVVHELGHALGFTSNAGLKELSPTSPNYLSVWDLFRFRPGTASGAFGTAQRILSSGGQQVFFSGAAELALSTGRPNGTGGDGEQSSHWKADEFTGRYIGIMDPSLSPGVREEITDNDLKALDLMGYQVNANPNPTPTPPNQQAVELKLDDGSGEWGAWDNGLIVVNRLTPPSYPATLQKLRFVFVQFQNQPDPTGKPISLVYFSDPSGAGQPPANAPLTRLNTSVPGTHATNFFEISLTNGPTINSGDFYIGYQAPSPYQGVGFYLDTSGQSPNRSFYSENNGAGYALLASGLQIPNANALIRAVVSVSGTTSTPTPTPTPVPTPRISALTSGVPRTGLIPAPPSAGNSAINDTQYTIQVPTGATQLRVTLSGNQDVDLYVRYNAPIAFQGSTPITDFKSESETGNEAVTITPSSSHALQAGTYFIAVANYGPGGASFNVTATVSQTRSVACVSAASFNGQALAVDSMVAAFGQSLATQTATAVNTLPTSLAGTTVKLRDRTGAERLAPLFFVAPSQVNYLIPTGVAPGVVTVTITAADGQVSTGTLNVTVVAPGLFSAAASGQGLATAVLLRVKTNGAQSYEAIARFDSSQNRFVALPIDLGPAGEQVFLILYGTGFRYRSNLAGAKATLGGVDAESLFAGEVSGLAGLDQLNLRIPRSLAGRGLVDVALNVDGQVANRVQVQIR